MKTFFRILNWLIFLLLSQIPLSLMIAVPRLLGHASYGGIDYLVFIFGFALTLFVAYMYAVKLSVIPRIKGSYFKGREIFQGFICLFVASSVSGIAAGLLGTVTTENQAQLGVISTAFPTILFALCTISAGFFEELAFRAGVFKLLAPGNKKIAAIFAIVLFTLAHWPTDLGSLLIYLSMAGVLTMLYYEYENFYVNMTVHALWNTMAAVLLLWG